jgi:hypothetical protein
MYEFNNRISTQREILNIVNSKISIKEQLMSLSSKAIDRWCASNSIDNNIEFVKIVREVSSKLFFLSNKSQEQVTENYTIIRDEITSLAKCLRTSLKNNNF